MLETLISNTTISLGLTAAADANFYGEAVDREEPNCKERGFWK